jgi:hypothetical protein
MFTDRALWTTENFQELYTRFCENLLTDKRSFLEKLAAQLHDAPAGVVQLAAECYWFLFLFPHKTKVLPQTKVSKVKEVWEWSGETVPESPLLQEDSPSLDGVGSPGTAYLTGIPFELEILINVMRRWKALSAAERTRLLNENAPWTFVAWLDQTESATSRAIRNILLYFLFPDQIERISSGKRKRQVYGAFTNKLPEDQRISEKQAPLAEIDLALFRIRQHIEAELNTTEVDFYHEPLRGQWLTAERDAGRREISAGIQKVLENYNLELRQCGSKKPRLIDCRPVDQSTGFWSDPSDATNKPLRWLVHLDLTTDPVSAVLPPGTDSRRIAFANTAQGTSGAVTIRVIPAIKTDNQQFNFYEVWEWLLLFCFLPALKKGSSAQLLEGYDPATGTLEYMGQSQPYIAAALIGLNADDDVYTATVDGQPKSITYAQATEALVSLLHIDPTVPTAAKEEGNANAE